MIVRDLLKLLADADPGSVVYIESTGHNFSPVCVDMVEVEKDNDRVVITGDGSWGTLEDY